MPNTTIPAPLAVLAFLGTLGLTGVLLLFAAWSAVRGRSVFARRSLLGAGGLLLAYGAVLLLAGVASHDRLLGAGEEKYFCEMDCHVAYHVTAARAGSPDSAGAVSWTVTVVTRFDPSTTSPRRPAGAPYYPGPRRAILRLEDGRELLGAIQGGTPWTTEIRPGESYHTEVGFILPAGPRPAAFLLEDGFEVGPLLIGHERSPFHAKVLLPLPAAGQG